MISKLLSYIDKLLIFATILLFIILLSLMTSEITLRYIFSKPIKSVIIYASFLFTWLAYLGCAFVSRDNEHLKVEYFINKFPPKIQDILNFIYKLTPLVMFIFLFKPTLNFFEFQYGIKVAGTNFSALYLTFAFVTGFLLMAIYSLVRSNSTIENLVFIDNDNKKIDK